MYFDKIIGGRHTSIDNLRKGIPNAFQLGLARAIKDLIKEGYIVKKPTSYGLQISLNHYMIARIEEIIR